jgi:capsular polysaccharide export protein
MIVYPAEFNPRKEAVFNALAQAAGGGVRFRVIPVSWRGFPETAVRTDLAVSRAKHQPRSALVKWLKRLLIRLQYNGARRYFAAHPDRIAVAWNGLAGSRMAFLAAARDAGARTLQAELAPFPGRITLDAVGVNAESSVPQDAAFYRTWATDDTRRGEAWRVMGANLQARTSRRHDVEQGGSDLPQTPFLFCPLQVPDDTQVSLFAGWCGGMAGFLNALHQAAQHLPEGWHLRLKEHPSARQSLRLLLEPLLQSGRVILDNSTDSFAQLAASRGVVTLNSSMGLQAFFHDKPVITLGRAFWAMPGLVTPASDQAALNAAFATAEALTYDPAFRATFMNWLDRVYYPRFTWPGGEADLAAFRAKLPVLAPTRPLG